ncbi:hypothetical protein RhiirC2_764286 [Rhizophagus irregularis]|uniref:Uncharacterized protein n=1 Tax=Rhizophagus irregularis TaxID=588596 RepID=A0A2N1M500_9GLOM|nr:hypothetical protein RhiirC2_764286 [Rhizophagus irregularis]
MPVQLSTILYISEYREKTSVVYPLSKENKPCYVPKLEEGQVLSIANSKFAIGPVDNQIDEQLRYQIQYLLQILVYNLNVLYWCFNIN